MTEADKLPGAVLVDKGYRGCMQIEGVRILRLGQRRGVTKTVRAMIERRSAIEPPLGT